MTDGRTDRWASWAAVAAKKYTKLATARPLLVVCILYWGQLDPKSLVCKKNQGTKKVYQTSELIRPDHSSCDDSWSDHSWPVISRSGFSFPTCAFLTQPHHSFQDMNILIYQTPLRLHPETHQTLFRNPPKIHQTHFRNHSDALQVPTSHIQILSGHSSDTLQTISRLILRFLDDWGYIFLDSNI